MSQITKDETDGSWVFHGGMAIDAYMPTAFSIACVNGSPLVR